MTDDIETDASTTQSISKVEPDQQQQGWTDDVNVNIKFTKSVSLIFTSSGCYDHHPQSWISYPLFDMTFL